MNRPTASDLPLFSALEQSRNRVGFHMPGHAGGSGFAAWFRDAVWSFDNTEIDILDNVNDPQGAARRSMEQTAAIFGAAFTWYVPSGSTIGLKTAIGSVVPAGGRLLLSRVSHKSIIHALAESSIEPVFLTDVMRDDGLLPLPLAPSQTAGYEDIDALIVTSPDYYGRLIDLKPFVRFAESLAIPLIVDAAHGAHLLVDPDLSKKRALAAGADLVIESAHKTLAALTPGSYLHVSEKALASGRVKEDRVQTMLNVYQTSSPSFPIAASLEYAAWSLAKEGRSLHQRRVAELEQFIQRLPESVKAVRGKDRDPLRLVLDLSRVKMTTRRFQKELMRRGIDIEMADFRDLVLIVSLYQDQVDFSSLLSAIETILALPEDKADALREAKRMAALTSDVLLTPPSFTCSMRHALFGDVKRQLVSIEDAEGSISSTVVSPTPPCIPLLWPGEMIEKKHLTLLRNVLPEGRMLSVISQDNVSEDRLHSC